ncbi:hypothetical protein ASD52_06680 [Ensifer sp. Root142]|uniref:hypothetical protein n=1 Tax=Ensifer sp. Root142 TaxID=1736461 RepID=UPI00070A2B1D|nr:hypothetical protein [Ensifer sp. Root142]KQY71361.1 hypothetical protein ASD52_06680 [Ensifer sp. Root142]
MNDKIAQLSKHKAFVSDIARSKPCDLLIATEDATCVDVTTGKPDKISKRDRFSVYENGDGLFLLGYLVGARRVRIERADFHSFIRESEY